MLEYIKKIFIVLNNLGFLDPRFAYPRLSEDPTNKVNLLIKEYKGELTVPNYFSLHSITT